MANAKNGCASDHDKKVLGYMANSGQAGTKTSDAKRLLEKANK